MAKNDSVAEVVPPGPGEEPTPAVEITGEPLTPESLSGVNEVRFHPVYGKRSFKPDEWAKVKGDLDWRFETAGEADMARTETEAQITLHANRMRTGEAIEKSGEGQPVGLSVQAHESAKTGYPEPGVVLPEDEKPK